MNILLIGTGNEKEMFEEKFGKKHRILLNIINENLTPDLIFHFPTEITRISIQSYNQQGIPVFFNIPLRSLLSLQENLKSVDFPCFGFNGLPTFFNNPLMEVSCLNNEQLDLMKSLLDKIGAEYRIVEDRPGMVTPRIIAMIINEAFYTVMEGTATKEDIDKAMKLGTNYPYGPFEWAEKIGINQIKIMLEEIYSHTHDDRYKACPLLKKEASASQ